MNEQAKPVIEDVFWGRCSPKTEHEKKVFMPPYSDDPQWRGNTCSHCGGIKPSIAMAAIRAGAEVVPTNKNYKIYLDLPDPDAGKLKVIGGMNFDPTDYNPADQGWIRADPELLKRDGWTVEGKKWIKLEVQRATKQTKCYLNHFSESQAVEFVVLLETKKMHVGYPGRFYSGLCFGIYKDAIAVALAVIRSQHKPVRVELFFADTMEKIMQTANITIGNKRLITAAFTDAKGNVQPLASKPVWSSSSPGVASVTPSDDGLSCVVIPITAGVTTIGVTAEGDPSPGVDTLTQSAQITVINPEDTQVALTIGDEVSQ